MTPPKPPTERTLTIVRVRPVVPFMTQASAAAEIGVSKQAIKNAIKDGRLQATEMQDGTIIIATSDLERFRKAREERAANPPKVKRRPKSPRSKKFTG